LWFAQACCELLPRNPSGHSVQKRSRRAFFKYQIVPLRASSFFADGAESKLGLCRRPDALIRRRRLSESRN
jgi:hypothetical protein